MERNLASMSCVVYEKHFCMLLKRPAHLNAKDLKYGTYSFGYAAHLISELWDRRVNFGLRAGGPQTDRDGVEMKGGAGSGVGGCVGMEGGSS